MSVNIINRYIELTKKQINTYMKLVFGNMFNKDYNEQFIEKYINARYYNYYQTDINETFRKKILSSLKDTEETLSINNISDRELIQKMNVFFQYVLYFDEVVKCKDIKQKIERISKLRKKLLNKTSKTFEETLYKKITESNNAKAGFIDSLKSEDFYIKLTNYPRKIDVYRVNLKHNVEVPIEYSDFAIRKAFNSGIIKEDKLIVEYYLTEELILKDILKQKFNKQYIVEFSETLFKKSKKLKSLFNIINNPASLEQIILKIQYEDYLENKEKIHDLLREGYKFAVVLDKTLTISSKDIQTLDIFKYVILNKQLDSYEKIKNYKIQNIIEV
ncbi:MAG: hypothetical protein IKF17_04955 [Clostridia bacterium]|nr:hypothetical protein [Clostridia bacterium]